MPSLSGHGVPFDFGKTARQVVAADYDRFDLIVCMDEWNVRLLKRIIPSDPLGKAPTDPPEKSPLKALSEAF